MMKCDQLIEYIMSSVLPEKSNTKCGVEDSPRPFCEK